MTGRASGEVRHHEGQHKHGEEGEDLAKFGERVHGVILVIGSAKK